jgi:hypothetical protein
MSVSLFQEGGPHDIRRTGQHTYRMKVSFPKDADGRTASACLPGQFKIKNGTGIAGAQESASCPGREIRVRPEDISAAIKTVLEILAFAHKSLFVDDKKRDKRTISNVESAAYKSFR